MYNATAMAYNRKHSIDKMDEISEVLIDHLLKILLSGPNHTSINHWSREVSTFVSRAYEWSFLKTNGRLKPADIYDHLFWCITTPSHIVRTFNRYAVEDYIPTKVTTSDHYLDLSKALYQDLLPWREEIAKFVISTPKSAVPARFKLDTSNLAASSTQKLLSSL